MRAQGFSEVAVCNGFGRRCHHKLNDKALFFKLLIMEAHDGRQPLLQGSAPSSCEIHVTGWCYERRMASVEPKGSMHA
jgi:hypothetical protein